MWPGFVCGILGSQCGGVKRWAFRRWAQGMATRLLGQIFTVLVGTQLLSSFLGHHAAPPSHNSCLQDAIGLE